MIKKYSKKDLEDFDKVNEHFDNVTDRFPELSLTEIGNNSFYILVKNGNLINTGLTTVEEFVMDYFDEFIYCEFETLSSGSLIIKIAGYDLK